METDTKLLTSILVIVCVILLILVNISYKVTATFKYYQLEPPPVSRNFARSFLPQ